MELPILTLSLAAGLDQDAPRSCETEKEKTPVGSLGWGPFLDRFSWYLWLLVPFLLPHHMVALDLDLLKPKEGIPLRMMSLRLSRSFLEDFPVERLGCISCPVFCRWRENPKSASVVALRPHSLDRYTGVLTPRSRCALFGLPFLASAAGNSRCYTQAEVHEGINWYEPEVDCHLSTQPPALPSFPLCGKNRACLQTGSFRMWT